MNAATEDLVIEVPRLGQAEALEEMRRRLPGLLDASPRSLVVDLSTTTRLSSGAVVALLGIRGACAPRGVRLQVRQPPVRAGATVRRLGAALCLDGGHP